MTGPCDDREAVGKLAGKALDEEIGVALAVVDEANALAAKVGKPRSDRNCRNLLDNGRLESRLHRDLPLVLSFGL